MACPASVTWGTTGIRLHQTACLRQALRLLHHQVQHLRQALLRRQLQVLRLAVRRVMEATVDAEINPIPRLMCWGCGRECSGTRNAKTKYCPECQLIHEDVLTLREKRLSDMAAAAMATPAQCRLTERLKRTRAGIGSGYDSSMCEFFSESDWQDALSPNEGDR
jgi:hypothetical protein